jgi:hypothetical protein
MPPTADDKPSRRGRKRNWVCPYCKIPIPHTPADNEWRINDHMNFHPSTDKLTKED